MDYSQLLQEQNLENVYVLVGDAYLATKSIQFFATKLSLEQFDISTFDDENFSSESVISACEQLSFFAQKRLVVVKDVTSISQSGKKPLQDYVSKISPMCTLLFVDTKRSNIFDFVKAKHVDLTLKGSALYALLSQKAKEFDREISSDALAYLVELCGQDILRMTIEIEKLCAYVNKGETIKKEDVFLLVKKSEEYAIFDLTNALGQKDMSKSLHLLSNLMGNAEQNSRIFSLLSNQMRRMFFIVTSRDKSDFQLANLFQIKEFAVKKMREQCKNFSAVKLKNILYELEQVEYMLKNAMFTQENALYYLITYITAQ